jgi:hypothetical protein
MKGNETMNKINSLNTVTLVINGKKITTALATDKETRAIIHAVAAAKLPTKN